MNRNIAKPFTATLSLLDVASDKTHKYKCFHGEDVQLTVNVVGEDKRRIDLSNTSVKIYFTLDKNVDEPVYRQDTGIVVDNLGVITVMLEKSYIRIGNNVLKIVLYDEDQTVFLQPLIISCIDPLIGEVADLEIPDDINVRDEIYDIRRIIGDLQDFDDDDLGSEIIEARKGHETVGERLDNFDSQLDTVVKKDYINALNPPPPLSPLSEDDSDIALKINAMFGIGKKIKIPFGEYNLNTKIIMPIGTALFGNATIKANSTDAYIEYNKDCRISGLSFIGQKLTGFKAISINDTRPFDITNISVSNYDIGIDGIGVTASTHDGGFISNSKFSGCNIGIYARQYFEYVNITSNAFVKNGSAIKVQGGNVNISSNYMCDNIIGIDVVDGLNGGHGVICGNQINHNEKSISLIGVPNGFTINGNNIFYGSLIVQNCREGAITITGNTLSCDWVFDNSEIVLGNNFFNQNGIDMTKVLVSDSAVVLAQNNMMDKRSVELMESKYRIEGRSLRVSSGSTTSPLTLNNYTILNFNVAKWLKYFGNVRTANIDSLITSNGEYITTMATSKGNIQVQCKIDLLLDTSYMEPFFPTLFFTGVDGSTYIIPQVDRGIQSDGKRLVSYVGSLIFPHQSGTTNNITLNILYDQISLASKIEVKANSEFILNGV